VVSAELEVLVEEVLDVVVPDVVPVELLVLAELETELVTALAAWCA
jgi:hypothetical protein